MGRYYDYDGGWPPYVPVAERRRKAAKKVDALRKQGKACQPVVIEGRAIARSFWGKAWCTNLEAYSDYENRLPRGRSYLRNGLVVDLQVEAGKVSALVAGTDIYQVNIAVRPLAPELWQGILGECTGKIGSLVELLQGRLSHAVMEVVTRRDTGLFPTARQVSFRCSCPDGAHMCKHVAAALYGVGARLDSQPELLFLLRQVDPQELILQAGSVPVMETGAAPGGPQQLQTSDLGSLFGIDLDEAPAAAAGSASAPESRTTFPKPIPKPAAAAPPAQSKPAQSKPAQNKPATGRRGKTVTARALTARGIPHYMMQNWLNSGVLLRTGQRGVYGTTERTEECIARYLYLGRGKNG